MRKHVASLKATIKAGKHIDKFFDELIQRLIQLHNSFKEEYRLRRAHTMAQQWEPFERKVLDKETRRFEELVAEVGTFRESDRLAEIYLNKEHYLQSLAKVEETLFDLGQYANLIQVEADMLKS